MFSPTVIKWLLSTKTYLYYTVAEISEMIGVGRTSAHVIVRQLNDELAAKGYFTLEMTI